MNSSRPLCFRARPGVRVRRRRDNRKVSAAAQSYVAAFTAHDANATCMALTHSTRAGAEFAREHMHLRARRRQAVALLPPANPTRRSAP